MSNATINARKRYGNSAHMGVGWRQKGCIKIAAKPLTDRHGYK